jgi:transcriptional regulator with XRE-family HTH domain
MSKDKFRKRKDRRRLIRGEMTKRGISGREIAARIGVDPSTVSKYCATSPRVIAALIEAGVPEKFFKQEAAHGR